MPLSCSRIHIIPCTIHASKTGKTIRKHPRFTNIMRNNISGLILKASLTRENKNRRNSTPTITPAYFITGSEQPSHCLLQSCRLSHKYFFNPCPHKIRPTQADRDSTFSPADPPNRIQEYACNNSWANHLSTVLFSDPPW